MNQSRFYGGCVLGLLLTLGAVGAGTNSVMYEDAGHPWRPPFGLDRVGRPTRVVIQAQAALSGGRSSGSSRIEATMKRRANGWSSPVDPRS